MIYIEIELTLNTICMYTCVKDGQVCASSKAKQKMIHTIIQNILVSFVTFEAHVQLFLKKGSPIKNQKRQFPFPFSVKSQFFPYSTTNVKIELHLHQFLTSVK